MPRRCSTSGAGDVKTGEIDSMTTGEIQHGGEHDGNSVTSIDPNPNNHETRSQLQNSSNASTSFPSLHGIKLIPEGGWGWAVCASSFLVQFIVLGINNSFGILFTFLLKEFGKSKGATAWAGSAAIGVMYLFGPITCGLNERIGFRTIAFIGGVLCILGMLLTSFVTEFYKIYVTYSLLWGIGSSLCYFSTLTVPGEYFCRRLSLANGIITAGSGFGTLTFGPLLQFLLRKYGLVITLRILSAIMTLLLIASLTFKRFRSPLEQMYNIKRKPVAFFDIKMWKNKAFVLYTAAVSLFMLGYFVPYVHVVSLVADMEISESDGAMLIGYMSISSTASRIIFGRLSDYPQVNRLYMTQFAMMGFGIMTLICPVLKTYKAFVAVMVMIGLFEGMYVVLIAVVITDIVGVHKLNQALGNLYGFISFAVTAGPPFAGFLYDALLSYNTAFYVCGVSTIFSSILLFLVPWLIRRHSGRGFERDSIDSRVDSLFSHRMSEFCSTADINTNCGVSQSKSGSRSTSLMKKKEKITGEQVNENIGGDCIAKSRPVESRQRSVSFASDKEDTEKDDLSLASKLTTRVGSKSFLSDKDESGRDDDSAFTRTRTAGRERSISFASGDVIDKIFTSHNETSRQRSISFASGDETKGIHVDEYIYDPTYDCDVFLSTSDTSSGCVLSNSLNTSMNTSFNSTMSHRGSKTKFLLSQYCSNSTRFPSTEYFRRSPSPQQLGRPRLTKPLCNNVQEKIEVIETIV